jgi:HK97 family phage major capsid protein
MPDTPSGGARLAEIRARQTEIRTRHAALQSEMATLGAVDGDLDESQRSAWDAGTAEFDTITAEHQTLEDEAAPLQARALRLNEIRSSNLATSAVAVTGDGAAGSGQARAAFNIGNTGTDDIYDRANMNPLNPKDGASYRDRASFAIDSWRSAEPEWKKSAQKLIDNADNSRRDRQVADHILTYGNPMYVRAFTAFLRQGPEGLHMVDRDDARYFTEARDRAVNEGSISAGQAIVPPFLDPTLLMTNAGIVNPIRSISTVKTITTQTWKGVTSAGVTAEWTSEAAEATDASPTFTQPSITPVRADAYVQASFETIEDTNLATDIAMLFADARDRLEGAAFAVGTGSTQPYGVVTELQLVTASRTSAQTNGSIGAIDVFTVDTNMSPRFRPNAQWIAAKGIINILRALATGPSQAQSAFWVDFGGAVPSKLIGYPMNEASAMQNSLSAATASNDDVLVLGDFKAGYYIVDRIGFSVAYNPLVIGANRRPTGEVGWFGSWRVGARAVVPSAFQLLRV